MTDLSKKTTGATCLRDKMDLLDYCKKVSETGNCCRCSLGQCEKPFQKSGYGRDGKRAAVLGLGMARLYNVLLIELKPHENCYLHSLLHLLCI